MITVWKFDLPVADGDYEIRMPLGAKILKVADQYDDLTKLAIWAMVDVDADPELRRFRMRGTGHPVLNANNPDETITHIGSMITFGGKLVWHVFEVQ
jgi:hypothetical protein